MLRWRNLQQIGYIADAGQSGCDTDDEATCEATSMSSHNNLKIDYYTRIEGAEILR